jgi:nitroreductase
MNPVLEAIKNRSSVREYSDKEVTDELLLLILDAARTAPSVHNIQPWYFGIVKGEKKCKIADILREHYTKMLFGFHTVMRQAATIIDNAPLIITVWNIQPLSSRLKNIKDISHEYHENISGYEIQSIAASIENMWIAAASLNLGMAWLGITTFCQNKISTLLDINGNLIAILTLGYPKEYAPVQRSNRNRLEKVVGYYR